MLLWKYWLYAGEGVIVEKPYRPVDQQKVFSISMQIARFIKELDPDRPERYALQLVDEEVESPEALVTEMRFSMFPRVHRWRARNIGHEGEFWASVWPQELADDLVAESNPLNEVQVESFFYELYHFSRMELYSVIEAVRSQQGSSSRQNPKYIEAIELYNSMSIIDAPRVAGD